MGKSVSKTGRTRYALRDLVLNTARQVGSIDRTMFGSGDNHSVAPFLRYLANVG